MGYRKVLLPVCGKDHLERAKPALEHALQIVREDGELCFFHCVEVVPYLIAGEAHKRLVREDAREEEKLIAPLVQRANDAGIACRVHIEEGSPAMHISKFATEEKFDVIVMFTGERNELGELIGKLVMGGIAERVLHSTSIPVLIVRSVA
ncbi:MAG: universal stress protein [Deltaproteobacteria bacterium]|jgi:nucleotide-binding universal stress UspA family protein|nr:universal stress protein [Deltaproteobacteria bacterium]